MQIKGRSDGSALQNSLSEALRLVFRLENRSMVQP